jgi:hypothetical protein
VKLPDSTMVKPAGARQSWARTNEQPKEHEYDLFLLAALRHLAEPPCIDPLPSHRRLWAA